jgi:hypothetical protein
MQYVEVVVRSHVQGYTVQVGVGDGDMGALTQLDSDRARLSSGHKQAVRDIVQFIRKFLNNVFFVIILKLICGAIAFHFILRPP